MNFCSRCSNIVKTKKRYCKTCHSSYMREWRQTHKLSQEEKIKSNARSYLHTYIKRGKIKKQLCEICNREAEAHHHDYSKPLDVRWFCPKHHKEHHKQLK